ncbi:MAG: hypothetical protein ABIP39_03370 [Polyangiaceae bacterium]
MLLGLLPRVVDVSTLRRKRSPLVRARLSGLRRSSISGRPSSPLEIFNPTEYRRDAISGDCAQGYVLGRGGSLETPITFARPDDCPLLHDAIAANGEVTVHFRFLARMPTVKIEFDSVAK